MTLPVCPRSRVFRATVRRVIQNRVGLLQQLLSLIQICHQQLHEPFECMILIILYGISCHVRQIFHGSIHPRWHRSPNPYQIQMQRSPQGQCLTFHYIIILVTQFLPILITSLDHRVQRIDDFIKRHEYSIQTGCKRSIIQIVHVGC